MHDMTHPILATASMIVAFPQSQPYNPPLPFSPNPTILCSHFGLCPDSQSSKKLDDTTRAVVLGATGKAGSQDDPRDASALVIYSQTQVEPLESY